MKEVEKEKKGMGKLEGFAHKNHIGFMRLLCYWKYFTDERIIKGSIGNL